MVDYKFDLIVLHDFPYDSAVYSCINGLYWRCLPSHVC